MVAPIIGPIITEIGGSGPDNQPLYSFKRAYRQGRPYNLALEYESHVGKVHARVGNPPYGARRVGTPDVIDWVTWTDLENKSYDKLKNSMADRAALAVTLMEGRQALTMIASRSRQLMLAAKELKKFNLPQVVKTLKLSAAPKGVSAKKAFASNWLEFSFGWSPLIMDIGACVDVLQKSLKEQYVRGSATSRRSQTDLSPPYAIYTPTAFNAASVQIGYERLTFSKQVSAQGCRVAVSNPNLFLANQLGFVNPATVAWELVPFSFVVDWFINVEQFLSSGTDFLGLTVEAPWSTRHLVVSYEWYKYVKYRWWDGVPSPFDGYYYTEVIDSLLSSGIHTARKDAISTPSLQVLPLKLPGWRRALTGMSLLVQQFSRS